MDEQAQPAPTYRIFRDQHGIPQFEPKRGTQALKDALIYAFPTLETELQLMQLALKKFFDSERGGGGSTFVCELPENNLQASLAKKREVPISPTVSGKQGLRNWKVDLGRQGRRTPSRTSSRASSRAPSRASSRAETPTGGSTRGTMTTWMLSNGKELEKRKRQPYDPAKRRKVAENRGNACEKHRASKTTCDPSLCPQNKLFSKAGGVMDEDSANNYSIAGSLQEDNVGNRDQVETRTIVQVASSNPVPQEQMLQATEVDQFWDSWDQDSTTLQPQNQELNLDNHNDSISWTDSTSVDLSPWTSSSYDTPSSLSNIEADPLLIHGVDKGLAIATQDAFTTPMNSGAQVPLWQPLSQLNKHDQCCDDPFMGWASKRVSHVIEDYSWVLSHVETL